MRVALRKGAEHAAVAAIVAVLLLISFTTWKPVKVTGWSMHPALHPGDLAFVRRAQPVRVGDIILFRAPGHGSVLHRVVFVDTGGVLRTRGDSNDVVDRDPLAPSMVVGPVRAVVPVGKLLERWREGDSCATMAVQSNSKKR